MLSRFVLPPEEFWRGTSPSQAANWRPLLKTFALPTLATNALAVSGPIPGIACKRWLAVSSRCHALISLSSSSTCRSSARWWSGLDYRAAIKRRALREWETILIKDTVRKHDVVVIPGERNHVTDHRNSQRSARLHRPRQLDRARLIHVQPPQKFSTTPASSNAGSNLYSKGSVARIRARSGSSSLLRRRTLLQVSQRFQSCGILRRHGL
jgi:hypothetical protein